MKNEPQYPLRIQKEEALLRRLLKMHPKYMQISSSVQKRKAGHRGELNVDYHLSFLPSNKYVILKNLYLQNNEKQFEIDRLLLSPNLILDIEIKNLAGTLLFDKHSKQLIQIYKGTEKGYPNPIQQAERQISQLKDWLHSQRLPFEPMDYLVTISHPTTILKSNDDTIFRKVMHAEHLVNKINELERKYRTPFLEQKLLRKMNKTFLKENSPPTKSILEVWDITPTEILTGVQCPYCLKYPMIRIHGTWFCQYCQRTSKDAHSQAIMDYFLLIKPTITNKECRQFLHINTRSTAHYMLRSLGLITVGTGKSTLYKLP